MFKNYITVTLRGIFRNKLYAFINVAGLSVGIACAILILLWVFDELSFDKFHPKADRLYQVLVNMDYEGKINTWGSVPLPPYEALKTVHSQIKNTAVASWGGKQLITVDEKKIFMRGMYASEEFLTMFEFPLTFGDAATVLNDASSIVITEETAKILFDDEDPINKVIRLGNLGDLKVAGILKNVPNNSTYQFDFLVPWKFRRAVEPWIKENEDNWRNCSFQIFVELSDKKYLDEVNKTIEPMLANHGQNEMNPKLFIYPIVRKRLHSRFENGYEKGGMIDIVKMFSLIAIFVLIIACINFMNLATARSEGRAREVGIRKTIGSRRLDLIYQFISESILISLVAYVFAILIVQLLLPFYNNLVEKELFLDYTSLEFWLFSSVIILFTGISAGTYPAFYLSAFQPVKVLKGNIAEGRNASLPRKILVITQFAFAIFLILGTIVIYNQIQLTKNRELGYNQDNLLMVELNDELYKNYQTLKNELLQTGLIEGVTRSNSAITELRSANLLSWPGKPEDLHVMFSTISTEYDYTHTMGIKMIMGRDFSREFPSDSSAIIVNKAALDIMQLEDPIGTELDLWGEKRRLIGVMDNVVMGSPYEEVSPVFAMIAHWGGGFITLRIKSGKDLNASIEKIKEIFEKYDSIYPFNYKFADQEFDRKFKSINMTSSLANLFATLAIMITGLGLFGLAAYTAEQRKKEIGIRKVMGASAFNIISLVTQNFSRLVIIAYLVAAPISWWLLNIYLKQYPIHTDIHFWVFIVTGAFILGFALLVVLTQTIRTAYANPVNSLRSE
jgi:ABC-type antimicrobial peptide transport system permease subunit